MSERGAEGILRRQAEERAAAAAAAKPAAQPVDAGTAGDRPPGKAKRAAAGAAGGAVGGPGGAAAGAVTGLLSGGKGKRTGGNKALVAEFVICMVLLGLSPLAHKGGNVTVSKFLKKGSATAAVFIILGFVSATGQTGRKVASGLGLLVTLTVLLNERSTFGVLVKAVGGESDAKAGADDPDDDPGAFAPDDLPGRILDGSFARDLVGGVISGDSAFDSFQRAQGAIPRGGGGRKFHRFCRGR